ncbi:MAG: DNA-formamidopyrimidine glycosylase family protein [Chitinophagaceae bacterium]
MPELPDIEVFTRNLHQALAGKKVSSIKIVNGQKLQDSQAALTRALKDKKLKKVYRSGKEMRFEFEGKQLLGLHLMLTGDLFIFQKKNEHHSTIVEFHFEDGTGLALTDRMHNANIKLDPVDKAGVDALSPDLTFSYLKEAFKRKKNVKKLLTDQDVIRGIGNSYSDEILWQARISPNSIAAAIPEAQIKLLLPIIRNTLKKEIDQIYKNYKGKINGEVKEFLQIHSKTKTKSPTGFPIIITSSGMMKTYYTEEQVLYK